MLFICHVELILAPKFPPRCSTLGRRVSASTPKRAGKFTCKRKIKSSPLTRASPPRRAGPPHINRPLNSLKTILVYSNCLDITKLAALQRLQSRAWSIIENAKIKDFWSSSWLNVENIIRCDRNVMTYKIVKRLCPENLLDKYLPRSYLSSYNTINSQDLQIPRSWTEFFKKSFHYASLKVWNETPSTIRELPTLNRFKQRLKTHLKG